MDPIEGAAGRRAVHRMESTVQAAYQHYYGFRLPRAEIAQAMSRQHQFEFSLPDNRYLPALQALMGQVVIYKRPMELLPGWRTGRDDGGDSKKFRCCLSDHRNQLGG